MHNEQIDRLHEPCDSIISQFSPEELIDACPSCGRFFTVCCFHKDIICHHAAVVYTDGACSNNGQSGAVAGIGIAFGTSEGTSHSIPVDDKLDPGSRRTSQRAELLAALVGLKKICDAHAEQLAHRAETRERHEALPVIVIATDSEYVVKGMTQWLSTWKENGLRKANGHKPSNLDLFRKLDAEVEKRERAHDCRIAFWHIDRTYNTIADRLAKNGASVAARAARECTIGTF